MTYLPTAVQDVFAESLHDSTIERIERDADMLQLYINTDGGFSSKTLIHLIFKGVIAEDQTRLSKLDNGLYMTSCRKPMMDLRFVYYLNARKASGQSP